MKKRLLQGGWTARAIAGAAASPSATVAAIFDYAKEGDRVKFDILTDRGKAAVCNL